VAAQVVPERVGRREVPAQDIEGEPAAVVFEGYLLGHSGRTVGLAKVFGLHELGFRVDFPDGQHS
jgi:hypothetical protein